MTRLQHAILDVLDCARGPLTAETILGRQRVTRQVSRIRLALEVMNADGVVSYDAKHGGWRRYGVIFQGERAVAPSPAKSQAQSQVIWSVL